MPLVPQCVDGKMQSLIKRLHKVEDKVGIGSSRLTHDKAANSYVEKEFSPTENSKQEKVSKKTYSGMGSGILRKFM